MAAKNEAVKTVKVGNQWKVVEPVQLQKYVIRQSHRTYFLAHQDDQQTRLIEADKLSELKAKIAEQLEAEGLGSFSAADEIPDPPMPEDKPKPKRTRKAKPKSEKQAREAKVTSGLKQGLKKAKATAKAKATPKAKPATEKKAKAPTPPPAPLNAREEKLAAALAEVTSAWTVAVPTAGKTAGKPCLVGISLKAPKRVLAVLEEHKYQVGDKPDGYSRNNPQKAMRTLWVLAG